MLTLLVVMFLVSGFLGVFAAETNRKRLLLVTKPLTTALLFGVVGWPHNMFSQLITGGILLSLVGDAALLSDSSQAFMLGLGSFLLAHVLYIVAFISVGQATASVAFYGIGVLLMTLLLLRRLWAGAGSMRAPVCVYGVAIATMVITAFSTNSGTLSAVSGRLASIGALLFFISDSTLALNKFHRPIRHSAIVTLGVYWVGQLGIALAARIG